jgi:hypothetical protein
LRVLDALNKTAIVVPTEKLERLITPIRSKLDSYPNDRIFGLCLIALARTGGPSSEALIREALDHTNKEVIESAAKALAVLKTNSTVTEELFRKSSESGFEALAEVEKWMLSVRTLEGEVDNGGFAQYFYNSSGGQAAYALRGLKEIGAHRTEDLLQQAMQLFGESGPSADRQTRIKQLDKLSCRAEARLHEFDEEFYKDLDQREVKMWLYIAEHPDDFKR